MKKNFETIQGSESNEQLLERVRGLETELAKTRNELKELERVSVIDIKTGAYNSRYMEKELPRILNEIFAYHRFVKDTDNEGRRGLVESASMIFFDLDGFKQANDKFGHLGVDDLLRHLSDSIKKSVRWGDFLIRHGGDEFALVLLNIDSKEAKNKAENLRKLIEEVGKDFGVTASVGLANYTPSMGFRKFVDLADKAAMESKKTGKNKVTVAGE